MSAEETIQELVRIQRDIKQVKTTLQACNPYDDKQMHWVMHLQQKQYDLETQYREKFNLARTTIQENTQGIHDITHWLNNASSTEDTATHTPAFSIVMNRNLLQRLQQETAQLQQGITQLDTGVPKPPPHQSYGCSW